MRHVLNFITYSCAICFTSAMLIITAIGVTLILEKVKEIYPIDSHTFISILLWGGFIFFIGCLQAFTLSFWNKYVRIKKQ